MDVTAGRPCIRAGMDQDIASFLADFGLQALAETFHENEFDTVGDLHEAEVALSDLAELGVTALKKRKLVLKGVAAAAAAAAALSPDATPQPEPEQKDSPRLAADRNETRTTAKSVRSAARMQQLSQPKSSGSGVASPARRQPTLTGTAAAIAAAELLHGTAAERREQQKREMQDRLEFQRTLKQMNALGRFPAEHGETFASAEQQDREREEYARARQAEWEAKQARKKSRSRTSRAAGSSLASTGRLNELSKPTVLSTEVWRAQKLEEKYAAVAQRSIHAPEKQQRVDISNVVGRLYVPARSEQSQSAATVASSLPAWGSPGASQPLQLSPAQADRSVRPSGRAKSKQPTLAESEALSRLQRSTRSSLASNESQNNRTTRSRPQALRTDKQAVKAPIRVKGRVKLRAPNLLQSAATALAIEEAEPPQTAKVQPEPEPEPEPEPCLSDEFDDERDGVQVGTVDE